MTSIRNGQRGAADGIVIAGGGLAAQRCAETLRRCGSDEPIRILCAEPHRPYDRPPLSKQLLAGGRAADELSYRDAGWYERSGIDLLCGVAATGLWPAERRVETSDGGHLRYDRLLIATGGRPRTLRALAGHENVLTLRTLDDALELRDRLEPGSRLAVVGAGFVGLEIAATASALGVEVTLIEAAATPLAAVLGDVVGAWFAQLHRSHGVRVLTGTGIVRVEATDGCVRALHLADGAVVGVDQILVGVGTDPDIDWLASSGLDVCHGVRVDISGATGLRDVFAAGDAAATFDACSGSHLPGSHWEAAARQGSAAARGMLGLPPGQLPVTSFWTDQYGLRIQFVGRAQPGDAVAIDGDPGAACFTATYTRAGLVTAVLLVDRPRSLPAARELIERGDPCHTRSR
jgi:3-phenylpropionate/trans-cinnamate dioxygenase ferredoxin reductase subunit